MKDKAGTFCQGRVLLVCKYTWLHLVLPPVTDSPLMYTTENRSHPLAL
jgi:hypothetical protein